MRNYTLVGAVLFCSLIKIGRSFLVRMCVRQILKRNLPQRNSEIRKIAPSICFGRIFFLCFVDFCSEAETVSKFRLCSSAILSCFVFIFTFIFDLLLLLHIPATSISCYVCNATDSNLPFQCGEWFERYDMPDIQPQDCSNVYGAKYCIKHIGRFEGNNCG